jgi:hypothetical protein
MQLAEAADEHRDRVARVRYVLDRELDRLREQPAVAVRPVADVGLLDTEFAGQPAGVGQLDGRLTVPPGARPSARKMARPSRELETEKSSLACAISARGCVETPGCAQPPATTASAASKSRLRSGRESIDGPGRVTPVDPLSTARLTVLARGRWP